MTQQTLAKCKNMYALISGPRPPPLFQLSNAPGSLHSWFGLEVIRILLANTEAKESTK